MLNDNSILAVIPARGGSKGVPRKNIKNFGGKPLIAWTIEEAKKSKYIDRLILTSEDDDIIRIAKEWGCEVPFVRPKELAEDDSPSIDAIIHAINTINENYDYVVLLQPTSPFRIVEDIDGCIEQCINNHVSSCVSVCEVKHSPYWMYTIDNNMKIEPFLTTVTVSRRQDSPVLHMLNGAVYVTKIRTLLNERTFIIKNSTIAYLMNQERSLDIDNEDDFEYGEWQVSKT